MIFKKVSSRYTESYQCYAGAGDPVILSGKRIARIDSPLRLEDRSYSRLWSVTFVGGHRVLSAGIALKVTNKIKSLSKKYRDGKANINELEGK